MPTNNTDTLDLTFETINSLDDILRLKGRHDFEFVKLRLEQLETLDRQAAMISGRKPRKDPKEIDEILDMQVLVQ